MRPIIHDSGMTLKTEKCQFGVTDEVKLLGHLVSVNGI